MSFLISVEAQIIDFKPFQLKSSSTVFIVKCHFPTKINISNKIAEVTCTNVLGGFPAHSELCCQLFRNLFDNFMTKYY